MDEKINTMVDTKEESQGSLMRNNEDLKLLPPGYRFRPTDEELVDYYLKNKLLNKCLPANEIKEANIYNCNPQELSDEQGEEAMYFFTPRDRKYPNGNRPNRVAGNGFWKASGKSTKVIGKDGNLIGFKRSLVYYQGKPKESTKTDWLMNEFTLNCNSSSDTSRSGPRDMKLDKWVLCKVYKKSKKGQQDDVEAVSIRSAVASEIYEPPMLQSSTCIVPAELPIVRHSHAMSSTSNSHMTLYKNGPNSFPVAQDTFLQNGGEDEVQLWINNYQHHHPGLNNQNFLDPIAWQVEEMNHMVNEPSVVDQQSYWQEFWS